MPRKSKNQIVELEDSDADTVSSISDDEKTVVSDDGSDDGSDSESDEEQIEIPKKEAKKAGSKKKTSKKEGSKKTAKKDASKKSSSKKEEEDEEFSLEKVLEDFDEKVKSFAEFEEKFISIQNETKEAAKTFKNSLRELKKEYRSFQVTLGKEYKRLNKLKRKTSSNRKKGGFTQAKPVPTKLCKYLGIPVDSELPRSEVTKKCYSEFKERKMNMGGRKYKFDKETAKVFGTKKDEEFHIHSFQGLLAGLYNENKKDL